ncbi:MAG TPA: insulinase family protein [Smithellaceae bacterium]|nr:insulinase family protein [Smithellaceae bacterium]
MPQANVPEPTMKAGDLSGGFKVLRVEIIEAIRLTAYEIEHIKTGAKVLHLHAFDRENLYAIGFRTPPEDSTGLPHILEHSVLAGSEKYPLRDAFKELIRSTMQTFINAFTYPDKTVYPVASQIKADFYNLARVYTDLVLRPRMLRETFLQEGHHLEFAVPGNIESDLIISGIVYNEMKGVYSSPDSLMYKDIQENLYPDSIYALDSGGNPDVIPELTYEQFRNFHRKYYSPTNARFFLYGDIPTSDHLQFLEEMLDGFDRAEVDSSIKSQPFFPAPRHVSGTYPVDQGESITNRTAVNLAWMLAENKDFETALLLEILSGLLVGSAASPLRKALIDSELGEDMTPVSGIESDLKQLMFCAGLRNVQNKDIPKIEKLILEALEKIVEKGFDRELVEGILHQVEFHGKEISRGSYPYGITLMGNVFQTWLYEGDPLAGLDFAKAIERIRNLWTDDPQIFQKMTRKWLVDNPHRLLAVLEPDPDFSRKNEEKIKQKMAALKNGFSREQLLEIDEQAARLKAFQAETDSPEAAASLPKLRLSDIPRQVETIPTEHKVLSSVPVLEHDLFTNGIAYVDLAFDIAHVSEDLQPYLPLLGKIMGGMGAAGFTYDEMSRRIALHMGGFGYDLTAGFLADATDTWQKMIFSFKALYRNVPEAIHTVCDILFAGDLDHEARMRDLIAERKNGLQSSVVPSGHAFAKRAAGAALTLPAYRDEQWHGRTQLRFVQQQSDNSDSVRKNLREKLEQLKSIIFTRNNLIINLTAEASGLELARENIGRLLAKLPQGQRMEKPDQPVLVPVSAGIAVPTQVSYVARTMKTPAYNDPSSAILLLASRELSNSYLYKHIRVQGGAYGGMSSFDSTLGIFSFLSYRDPHIAETLNVFQEAQKFYAEHDMAPEDMEKAIISALGALDKPLDPSGRGYVAMIRHFVGVTDQMRQSFRDRIFSATPHKVRETLAGYFEKASRSKAVAVFAAQEKLNEANKQMTDKLNLEKLSEA